MNKSVMMFCLALGAAACHKGTAMTIDELVQKSETLAGSRVTIQAVSWGTNDMVGGGKRLNLAKVPLEGFQQAPVVADYAPGQKAPEVAKNATVKLSCTVGEPGFGQIKLKDCSVD